MHAARADYIATQILNADRAEAQADDALFFLAGAEAQTTALAGRLRLHLADALDLRRAGFHFCWVVDFPLYAWDEEKQAPQFFHNPFSMPQGGLEALESDDPDSAECMN